MTPLKTHFVPHEIAYSGEQLQSHWAYRSWDLLGDSIVAFVGPCDVRPEYMKDVQDLKAGSRIYSEKMLHFIVEHFGCGLNEAVLRQWLLIAMMGEKLNVLLNEAGAHAGREAAGEPGRSPKGRIMRRGSDLYDGTRKLSVSIASVSRVSALIHVGINVCSRNTPVPTRGLDDYGIEARGFGEDILSGYAEECEGIFRARCKVLGCE